MTEDVYTPTEARLRSIRHGWASSTPGDYVQNAAEFDRWLAEVKAEAWDEGYDAHADDTGLSQMMRDMGEDNGNPYRARS